jgi:hypothetical protein
MEGRVKTTDYYALCEAVDWLQSAMIEDPKPVPLGCYICPLNNSPFCPVLKGKEPEQQICHAAIVSHLRTQGKDVKKILKVNKVSK